MAEPKTKLVTRTQPDITTEIGRLGRTHVLMVAPVMPDFAPNNMPVPGTEYLEALIENAAQGYIATGTDPSIYAMTPSKRRQATPSFAKLSKAIQKAQQEGRFQ